MNSKRIQHILTLDPYAKLVFSGFGYPDLPLLIKKFPALLILNTDKSTGPGEHWCVSFFRNNKYCEFFDPYGMSPDVYNFTERIFEHCSTIQYNKKQVQGLNQSTCGHHCIFFTLYRSRGIPCETILSNIYSNNIDSNDKLVYNFMKQFGSIMSRIEL